MSLVVLETHPSASLPPSSSSLRQATKPSPHKACQCRSGRRAENAGIPSDRPATKVQKQHQGRETAGAPLPASSGGGGGGGGAEEAEKIIHSAPIGMHRTRPRPPLRPRLDARSPPIIRIRSSSRSTRRRTRNVRHRRPCLRLLAVPEARFPSSYTPWKIRRRERKKRKRRKAIYPPAPPCRHSRPRRQ